MTLNALSMSHKAVSISVLLYQLASPGFPLALNDMGCPFLILTRPGHYHLEGVTFHISRTLFMIYLLPPS